MLKKPPPECEVPLPLIEVPVEEAASIPAAEGRATVERKILIDQLLASLYPDERTVVSLTLDGFKQWEIADRLGLTQGRVSQIYQGAVKRMQCFAGATTTSTEPKA